MNPKNVLAEFSRAQKSLQAAQLLQADGLFEDAVSRAYYAVMHAAKAALLIHDRLAESHVAIRRYFGSVLVRAGRIEKEWAGILAREHDRRVAADYNANLTRSSGVTGSRGSMTFSSLRILLAIDNTFANYGELK